MKGILEQRKTKRLGATTPANRVEPREKTLVPMFARTLRA